MFIDPLLLMHLSKLMRRGRPRRLPLHIIANLQLIQLPLEDHPTLAQVHALLLQLFVQVPLI